MDTFHSPYTLLNARYFEVRAMCESGKTDLVMKEAKELVALLGPYRKIQLVSKTRQSFTEDTYAHTLWI